MLISLSDRSGVKHELTFFAGNKLFLFFCQFGTSAGEGKVTEGTMGQYEGLYPEGNKGRCQ